MELYCSYCARHLGQKEPYDDARKTHGICHECRDYFLWQEQGLSFDEYLGAFAVPVLIVDGNGRIAAINGSAAAMLGRAGDRVRGLLGGEAMECAYARLPQGCGNTVHCLTCTIRKAVEATAALRHPGRKSRVTLNRDGVLTEMLIETSWHEGMVRIVVEEVNVPTKTEAGL